MGPSPALEIVPPDVGVHRCGAEKGNVNIPGRCGFSECVLNQAVVEILVDSSLPLPGAGACTTVRAWGSHGRTLRDCRAEFEGTWARCDKDDRTA